VPEPRAPAIPCRAGGPLQVPGPVAFGRAPATVSSRPAAAVHGSERARRTGQAGKATTGRVASRGRKNLSPPLPVTPRRLSPATTTHTLHDPASTWTGFMGLASEPRLLTDRMRADGEGYVSDPCRRSPLFSISSSHSASSFLPKASFRRTPSERDPASGEQSGISGGGEGAGPPTGTGDDWRRPGCRTRRSRLHAVLTSAFGWAPGSSANSRRHNGKHLVTKARDPDRGKPVHAARGRPGSTGAPWNRSINGAPRLGASFRRLARLGGQRGVWLLRVSADGPAGTRLAPSDGDLGATGENRARVFYPVGQSSPLV